jgi:hypothetical protein
MRKSQSRYLGGVHAEEVEFYEKFSFRRLQAIIVLIEHGQNRERR